MLLLSIGLICIQCLAACISTKLVSNILALGRIYYIQTAVAAASAKRTSKTKDTGIKSSDTSAHEPIDSRARLLTHTTYLHACIYNFCLHIDSH